MSWPGWPSWPPRSSRRRLAAAVALSCALAPGAALAGPPERAKPEAGRDRDQEVTMARADSGTPPPPPPPRAAPALSDEDREVVENLDLLQSMEEAGDLDLLLEMGQGGGED